MVWQLKIIFRIYRGLGMVFIRVDKKNSIFIAWYSEKFSS